MTTAVTPEEKFFLALSDDETFTQNDAEKVVEKFVCAVCWSDLQVVYIPNEARALVVCIEHGNVCYCGRVTHATVSIEMENAYKNYYKAIHNLPDLWGGKIHEGFEREHAVRIARENVCKVCGQMLLPQVSFTTQKYDVICNYHGSVSDCGYIKKDKFVWDYQAMRAWEKEHQKR